MADAGGVLKKNKKRNDALLSVYQACSECKGADIPGWAAAIPLNQAVKELMEDDLEDDLEDAFSLSRRALVRLLRAKVHHRHPLGSVVDRLAKAVGCTPDGVRLPVDDPVLDGPTKEKNLFVALEVPLRDRLRARRSLDLEKRTPTTKVVYSPTNLVSTVTGTVEVPGDPDDFARIIDPRYWASAPDSPFRKSKAADPRGWNGLGEPPGEGPENPDPGSPWKGVLYEDVLFRMNGATQSCFRNLLHIDQTNDDKEIKTRYWLYQSLSNQLGLFRRRGGIDVDSGFFSASRTDRKGWTEVKVEKALRFTDATPHDTGPGGWDYGQMLNYLAPSFVGMWIEAVMTEIGERAFPNPSSGPAEPPRRVR